MPFELTGRAQLGHEMGGRWDEWYATFSNGWLGWFAEAQGRFYLTFQYPIPDGVQLPAFDQLHLGQPVHGLPSPSPMIVAETGRATALGAKGEIPYLLTPGETYYYADLSGSIAPSEHSITTNRLHSSSWANKSRSRKSESRPRARLNVKSVTLAPHN